MLRTRISVNANRIIIGVVALLTIIAAWGPRYPQPASYHQFAHEASVAGVPNFWNVVSNAAFLLVAHFGALHMRGGRGATVSSCAALVFLGGVFLTGLGSAYYHWSPTTQTLFWDRLPMTIAFSAVVAGLVERRINPQLGRRLLWPLLLASAGTVIYWRWSESVGRGNLVPYGIVQFGTVLFVLSVLLKYPERTPQQRSLCQAFAFYALAKLFEGVDHQIGAALRVMGGHPIKHVAAAVACWFLWLGVFQRGKKSESNSLL